MSGMNNQENTFFRCMVLSTGHAVLSLRRAPNHAIQNGRESSFMWYTRGA